MSSSRIIVTKKQPVIIGNICSCCGSPVLSTILIVAKAEKTYSFSSIKATQIATNTADLAISDEIKRIESCGRFRKVLAPKDNRTNMIQAGLFCSVSLEGLRSVCPNCGFLEPWRDSRNFSFEMKQLADNNFPVVFQERKNAEAWVRQSISEIIERIEAKRLSTEVVANAKKELDKLHAAIDELKIRRDSLPELNKRNLLEKEKASVLLQKKDVRLLDIRKKRNLLCRIKSIEFSIENEGNEIRRRQHEIDVQIVKGCIAAQKMQLLAFGCTGRYITRELGESISFQIESGAPSL